ncbi:hypothetical protein [Halofilum ochraceum]|uniref:hypothetical protein n=1 Tax=Halofilum ochraceum TaxID=1611323 RepID=UPI0008D95EE7|nr:hypothetical protein [Halofilum ochraceum]
MTRNRTGIVLAVLLALAPTWVAANREFIAFDPDTVSVPEGLTENETTKALMTAFVMRGWRMTEVSRDQGYIDAEIPVRAHVGRVRAQIDDGVISFQFREGENLPQKWLTDRGGTTGKEIFYKKQDESDVMAVHRNYLSWVQELARTVEGTLRLQSLPKDG